MAHIMQVMASLSGSDVTAEQEEVTSTHDAGPLPQFQQHAEPRLEQPASTLQDAENKHASPSEDTSSVAVHKFPVDKQLLLQMRFRQLYGRSSASLVTTPAKSLPMRSLAAGLVSPSHVGPAWPDTLNKAIPDASATEAALHLRASQAERPEAAHQTQYRQNPAARWPDRPVPGAPRFEDLRSQQDTAAAQQPEGIGALVQHELADPGVYSQWPESPDRQVAPHEPYPIPMQQLHSLQPPLPSYAWSTEQLTAIATAAATAAATAVQRHSCQVEAAKAAQDLPIVGGTLTEPVIRQGLQGQSALQALPHSTTAADDVQLLTHQMMSSAVHHTAGQDTDAVSMARLSSPRHDSRVQQPQQARGHQAAPKQSDALQKLKHRKSVGRGAVGHMSQARLASSPGREGAVVSRREALPEQAAAPMETGDQPAEQRPIAVPLLEQQVCLLHVCQVDLHGTGLSACTTDRG